MTSVKTAAGQELLFVSEASTFDGAAPIRGGIPIVFPKFGGGWEGASNPRGLPSHGFARRCKWTLAIADDKVQFKLDSSDLSEEYAKEFPSAFSARYEVALSASGFRSGLIVTNTGEASFEFQALLHTYYNIEAVGGISVEGLDGVKYTDKLASGADLTQGEGPVVIVGETDRIYKNAPGAVNLVGLAGNIGTATVGIECSEDVVDCVVWNPWDVKAGKMGDFGDEEYHKMVCIEPGYVAKQLQLLPGKTFSLFQDVKLAKL